MKLFNSLTKKKEEFKPVREGAASVYTCGPTVYDQIHIGNLRAFIFADSLARALRLNGYRVKHIMNITDVDDKTIERSRAEYPELAPTEALKELAKKYEAAFKRDSEDAGIKLSAIKLVRATEHISEMQAIIARIATAYAGEDGIYFDLHKYVESGNEYGRLSPVDLDSRQNRERIKNDEYDKADAHDFALWKTAGPDEPAWDFKWQGENLSGRPGWHIECSAMSANYLELPLDIHTGGVDLKFPHHENEIAQTRAAEDKELANYFIHNEHLLVEGKKMSKSLNNFITLGEIKRRGHSPLAFRLLLLQAHYRSHQNFTWEALGAAENFLEKIFALADRQFQPRAADIDPDFEGRLEELKNIVLERLADDLDTAGALAALAAFLDTVEELIITESDNEYFADFLAFLDEAFGLGLTKRKDITEADKLKLVRREEARSNGDFALADALRQELKSHGIHLNDTAHGTYWYQLKLPKTPKG